MINLMATYFSPCENKFLECCSWFLWQYQLFYQEKVAYDDREYVLINLYNGNTKPEQLKILESQSKVLKNFQDTSEKNIIFVGDFYKISLKGTLFLQETHSSKVTEKVWNDKFNGDSFFSYAKTNSCSVLIRLNGNSIILLRKS